MRTHDAIAKRHLNVARAHGRVHCASLSPAAWITFCHFVHSALMSLPNSSGVEPTTSTPCFARFSFKEGAPSALTVAACSLVMSGRGVARGARIPYQPVVLKSRPL